MLRTTQARKSKPTIQISCESKSGPAQRPYVGDAQLASSVGISYKAVVWQGLKQGENVRRTFRKSCRERIRWVLSRSTWWERRQKRLEDRECEREEEQSGLREGSYQTLQTVSGTTKHEQHEERDREIEWLCKLMRDCELEVRNRR